MRDSCAQTAETVREFHTPMERQPNYFRLLRCGNSGEHGIEVCRRQVFGKLTIPEPVLVYAVFFIPQFCPDQLLHVLILSQELRCVFLFSENICDLRQALRIQCV